MSDRLQQIRDSWLLAVQEENAEAAGWCARLCENLRGAEAFAASDGLDAFISVAMGQSMSGSGGLMVALAQALTMQMSDFKVAVFETLCAAAQWPSLKGRIAGCGVLGVITATLLSRHPPSAKALMARLCGLLAMDSPEARQLGDARRAEEFQRLRGQLIASGAFKAIVDMLGGDPVEAAASASVMAKLADTVNETESEGDSAHHGGSHREKDGKESKRGKAEGKGGDTEKDEKERGESQRVEGVAGAVGGAEGRAEGVQGDGDTAALRDLIAAAVRRMIDRLRHRTEQTEQTCDEDDSELVALEAIASSLALLARLERCKDLIAPITEPRAVEDLCQALGVARGGGFNLGGFSEQRKMIEHLLHCLCELGTRHGCWPDLGKGLAEDLYGLLLLRCPAAAQFLEAILKSEKSASISNGASDSTSTTSTTSTSRPLSPLSPHAFLYHFDMKRLKLALHALEEHKDEKDAIASVSVSSVSSGPVRSVLKILDSFGTCRGCGVIKNITSTALLACGNCKLAAYCSKECQRADWKSHKLQCISVPQNGPFFKASEHRDLP